MREREVMKQKIDDLESAKLELKNQVENYELNNERFMDEVEKVQKENDLENTET